MIRGVVLTLGAIVTLAGLNGARADGLPLFGWPALSAADPATMGVFPSLPQNWADLPVQFHISEQVGYNSNINNVPTGPGISNDFGRPIGAMESISTYGVSFKNQIGAQQFFGDANWGMYRYLNNAFWNTGHSSVDLGDNFTYGSKCTGSVTLSEATAPSLPGQQISFNVVNNQTTLNANASLRCAINGEYSGIFNTGFSESQNSAFLDKANNSQSAFIAAGISYAVSETNSFQVLATVTGTNYSDRGVLLNAATGLNSDITTDSVMATYTKNFSPNLSVVASLGLIGVTYSYLDFAVPRTILPQYSVAVQWAATPRLSLNMSASRSVSTPTAVLSNLQVTESTSAGFSYQVTPKISMSAGLSAGYATGVSTPIVTSGILSVFTSNQKTYGANAAVSYLITPFLNAALSYQFSRAVQSNLTTNDSLILLALNFNPY